MCDYLKALQKPFPASDIEWRVDHASKTPTGAKVLVLAYVTNRAIMERLDEVFGIAGWKNEYREWRDKGVMCIVSCKINDEWIAKADGADATNIEATKGGFSASMKRTAVQWGIGRYLYNLEQTWIPILANGKNFINTSVGPKDKKEWIKGYWNTPTLPTWALPEGYEHKELPLTQAHEPIVDESLVNVSDDDLNALSKASEEFVNTPVTPKKETLPTTGNVLNDALQNTAGTSNLISEAQVKYSHKLRHDKKINEDDFKRMIAEYSEGNVEIKQLTKKQASAFINFLTAYSVQESA
jgi:hypothetical protein